METNTFDKWLLGALAGRRLSQAEFARRLPGAEAIENPDARVSAWCRGDRVPPRLALSEILDALAAGAAERAAAEAACVASERQRASERVAKAGAL